MYYNLMKLPAINIVYYLCLSTKCFNRGRLIWNSNTSSTMISDMLIRNIQDQHHIEKVKATCYFNVFTLCQKEGCVSLLTPNCDIALHIVEYYKGPVNIYRGEGGAVHFKFSIEKKCMSYRTKTQKK